MAILELRDYLRLLSHLKETPEQSVSLSYDKEADILYVNYKTPSVATDSEMIDDDVILRYQNSRVIGMTILHASSR